MPAIVTLICGVALSLIPFRIVGLGYLPFDDALRHAAKVISGKPWTAILVLRDGITLDNHPGWHAVLDLLRRACGLDATQLVIAAVVLLFLLFSLTPLLFLERRESWLAALLILMTGHIANFQRLLTGRPYLVSMTALLIILFAWAPGRVDKSPRRTMALVALAIAAAVWIHGSWYLFALPLAAFFAARAWRDACKLGVCTLTGLVLGASLTGEPYAFLKQNALHAWNAFGALPARRMLVAEFQSFDGYPLIVVAVVAIVFWRWSRGEWHERFLGTPAFMLATAGYLLGFVASRFWYDWGVPALCVWMALELQTVLQSRAARTSWSRVGAAAILSIACVLVATNDYGNRYTDTPAAERLSLKNPEHAPWLPAAGGIVYSNSLSIFYRTFFENPLASWRYLPGFEPTLMPEEDLEVYRQYFRLDGSPAAFKPWIQKLRPEDRLVLVHASAVPPLIPELLWFHATRDIWIGRLRGRD